MLKLLSLPSPAEIVLQIQQEKLKEKDIKPDKLPLSTSSDKHLFYQSLISKPVFNALLKRTLSIAIRSQINKPNQSRLWVVEFIFNSTPLLSSHHKEQGKRRAVYLQYEMLPVDQIGNTVETLLYDWIKIVCLYSLVHDFAELYNADKYNLKNIVTIKSYSYTSLLMLYGVGQNKEVNVNISWCNDIKQFQLTFVGGNSAINAHSMMRDQLQSYLNENYSLAQLVHILNETYQPLSSIAKLSILPQLGIPVRLYSTRMTRTHSILIFFFFFRVPKFQCYHFA